jgi:hypothetical protein
MPGVAYTFQWLRGGVRIAGATRSTYTPVKADIGKRLSVRITGTRADGAVFVAVVDASAAVSLPQVIGKTVKLKIKGSKATVVGKWKTKGVKVSYRWLRAGKAIKGARGKSYRFTAKDVGKTIAVEVTAKKAGHRKLTQSLKVKVVKR